MFGESSRSACPAATTADSAARRLVDRDVLDRGSIRGVEPVPEADEDPRFATFELESYLGSARGALRGGATNVGGLPPTSLKEADDFRAQLVAAAQETLPKLPEEPELPARLSLPELKDRAAQAAQFVAAVAPKAEGLAAAVGHGPALAASHDLAPRCTPRRRLRHR